MLSHKAMPSNGGGGFGACLGGGAGVVAFAFVVQGLAFAVVAVLFFAVAVVLG